MLILRLYWTHSGHDYCWKNLSTRLISTSTAPLVGMACLEDGEPNWSRKNGFKSPIGDGTVAASSARLDLAQVIEITGTSTATCHVQKGL